MSGFLGLLAFVNATGYWFYLQRCKWVQMGENGMAMAFERVMDREHDDMVSGEECRMQNVERRILKVESSECKPVEGK